MSLPDIEHVLKRHKGAAEFLPGNEIVGDLKVIIVRQGREKEFETLFRQFATKVKKLDDGISYYDLYKAEQPRTYVVMAQYQNTDTLHQHQVADHSKEFGAKLRDLVEKIETNYFICSVRFGSLH